MSVLATPHRPIVLLGSFEPVVALGLHRALARCGLSAIIGPERAEELAEIAERLQPDAVILGLEGPASRQLGQRIRLAASRARVVLLARDEETVEMLSPGRPRPLRFFRGVDELLASELSRQSPTRARSASCPIT